MSQMLKAALWYAELGWHVFPIVPGHKEPMTKNGVLDASCDPAQIELWWGATPTANIGLACGAKSGVYVVDVDVDTEKGIDGFKALEGLIDTWPDTVTQLTPRGGSHYFFQTNDPPRNKNNFKEGIDIRGEGYYVLLAPSLHPNGKIYQWAPNREPQEIPLATYPKYMRPKPVETVPMATLPRIDISTSVRLGRAKAYLAKIAPAEQGKGGHDALFWAATCMVHGFELADSEALALLENEYNPRCIPPWNMRNPRDNKDFKRKVDEARRCPPGKPLGWLLHDTGVEVDQKFNKQVDNLLAAEIEEKIYGVSECEKEAISRQVKEEIESAHELLGIPKEEKPSPIYGIPYWITNKTNEEIESLDLANVGKREEEFEKKTWQEEALTYDNIQITASEDKEIDILKLKERLISGHSGMLKDLVKWIDSTSFKFQPMLTLGCALTFLGALFGRKVKDEHGGRTNLYAMGIATSSAGKAHAMQCVRHLAHISGAGDLIGGSSVASDVAVINSLAKYKSVLYMWDEIGFLLAAVKSQYAGANKMLIPTLMTLFSSASDVYLGREYADVDKRVKLIQPCCCLWGTSEVSRFIEGLNPKELNDGWLSRCLMFRAEGSPPLDMDNDCFEGTAPKGLIEMVGEWFARVIGDPDNSQDWKVKNGVPLEPPPQQIIVPTTEEAEKVFRKFITECTAAGKKDTKIKALWDKAQENARKIALILAASDNFYEPEITVEMAEYACDLIRYLIEDFTKVFVDDIIDSRNAEHNRRIFNIIAKCGTRGCTKSQLTANSNFLRRQEREAVIADLLEGEQIITIVSLPNPKVRHPGRPSTVFYTSEFYREKLYEDRAREGEHSDAPTNQSASPELPSWIEGGSLHEGSSDEEIPPASEGES